MTREHAKRQLVPRSAAVTATLAGLALGICGIVAHFVVEPDKYPGFPPGALVIAAAGFGVWYWQNRTWGTLPAILVAVVVVVIGGFIAGEMTANFQSPNILVVITNAVILLGLGSSAITGLVAVAGGRHASAGRNAPVRHPR